MFFILPLNIFKSGLWTDHSKQQEVCLLSEQEEVPLAPKDPGIGCPAHFLQEFQMASGAGLQATRKHRSSFVVHHWLSVREIIHLGFLRPGPRGLRKETLKGIQMGHCELRTYVWGASWISWLLSFISTNLQAWLFFLTAMDFYKY